jgi:hypothetical protein
MQLRLLGRLGMFTMHADLLPTSSNHSHSRACASFRHVLQQ